MPRRSTSTPATCHPREPLAARGLCGGCYDHHYRAGTLADFPLHRMPTADFVAEYLHIGGPRMTSGQVAERMGLRRGTVMTAIWRARKAGLLPAL